jgi:hypothetical protein
MLCLYLNLCAVIAFNHLRILFQNRSIVRIKNVINFRDHGLLLICSEIYDYLSTFQNWNLKLKRKSLNDKLLRHWY